MAHNDTNQLREKLENELRTIPEYLDENQNLAYNIIKDDAENYQPRLLNLLLQNDYLKNIFFIEVEGSNLVFKQKVFTDIFDFNAAINSYSKFAGKKIGLYFANTALADCNDVVLNFPFKDCVLEGGQTKEDGQEIYYNAELEQKTEKRKEIFYNEILAYDEIDSLFAPKALCNAKRYDATAEGTKGIACTTLNRDAEINKARNLPEDTITDNLIIKGNNLLALHSLEKEFAGKVKLIYIDPPYNTGNDSFAYNDKFNHSSWLTFMKNRLEVAKRLLKDDGCIFVQCDDNEQAYLKVLIDGVFGRENFVASLPRVTKKAGKSTDMISKNHDYILFFKKETITINQLDIKSEDYPLKDEYFEQRGGYKLSQTLDYDSLQYSKTMDYEAIIDGKKFYPGGENKWIERKNGKVNKIDWVWRWSKEKLEYGLHNGFVQVKGNRIYTKTYCNAIISKSKPYEIEYIKRGKNFLSIEFVENQYSNDMASKNIQQIFHEKNLFNYSKPEALLERIIKISTQPSDIVLDYHLGSGTTAAVAHKMGRQYIGIEQMDYIESISCERMRKVIGVEADNSDLLGNKEIVGYDNGGISKAVKWSGGGSFIYLELAERNEKAKAEIAACENIEQLAALFDTLSKKYFLHYNVHINDFKNEITQSEKFKALDLEKQKEMFCRMLDLNQMYVNFGDRHDKDAGLTKEDIMFSEAFYKVLS